MALRASLPMYDLYEVSGWTGNLWTVIAEELREGGVRGVPDALERPSDHHDAWRPDGLLFSQSCGHPVATMLRDVVRIVASIREALGRAFARPDLAETREALLIRGLSMLSVDAYEPLREMERAAAASGYPDLE